MPGYVTVTASVSCPDFGADMPTTERGHHQAKIEGQCILVQAKGCRMPHQARAIDNPASSHLSNG